MPDPGYSYLPSSRSYIITTAVTPTLNWFRVRKEILIQNLGTVPVYIGFWPNLTTSGDGQGILLPAGLAMNVSNPHSSATFNSPVYMMTATGTTEVIITECV